jgi:hypothetical protein
VPTESRAASTTSWTATATNYATGGIDPESQAVAPRVEVELGEWCVLACMIETRTGSRGRCSVNDDLYRPPKRAAEPEVVAARHWYGDLLVGGG